MGRKKQLSIDIDSAKVLMQEIYNDVSQQMTTANQIMRKMLSFMKESEDMTVIGPVIKEQQKILTACTDKKLALVKLQSILLKQTDGKGSSEMTGGKLGLTADDRKFLEQYMISGNDDEEKRKEEGRYES